MTSDVIVAEVVRALGRDRVRRKYRIAGDDIERVRQLLEQELVSTPITVQVAGVATHPEDGMILATAVSARADYLVTGDVQLQRLETYQGVAIVSPRQSLEILHGGYRRRRTVAIPGAEQEDCQGAASPATAAPPPAPAPRPRSPLPQA